MMDNAEIKGGGNWLEAGIHDCTVFNVKMEEFLNRNSEERKKAIVQFKTLDGGMHSEDFLIHEKCMWRLKDLSIACGIGEEAKWDFPDIIGNFVRVHLRGVSYTDKDGNTKEKSEAFKFEPLEGEISETDKILKQAEKDKPPVDSGISKEEEKKIMDDPF